MSNRLILLARLGIALVNNAHSEKCKKQSFFQEGESFSIHPITNQYCSHPECEDRKYYRTLTRSL